MNRKGEATYSSLSAYSKILAGATLSPWAMASGICMNWAQTWNTLTAIKRNRYHPPLELSTWNWKYSLSLEGLSIFPSTRWTLQAMESLCTNSYEQSNKLKTSYTTRSPNSQISVQCSVTWAAPANHEPLPKTSDTHFFALHYFLFTYNFQRSFYTNPHVHEHKDSPNLYRLTFGCQSILN